MNTREQEILMDKIYKINKARYQGNCSKEGMDFIKKFSAELREQLRKTEQVN